MKEDEGMQEEEMSESPEEEKEEGEDNVKISEEFQKEVSELINDATIPELDFMSSQISEIRQKLMSSQKKSHLNTANFSTEGMPS